jgi:hypothetical protein
MNRYYFSRLLALASFAALMMFATVAIAGPVAILDDLQNQNASVTMLDGNSMDNARAKTTYMLGMSRPGINEVGGGKFYEFYNAAYQLVHTAFYSAATSIRPTSVSTAPNIDEYFVDAGNTPGGYSQSHLLTVNRSTGDVDVHCTERVMYIDFNGLGVLGRFVMIPGFRAFPNLPMSSSTTSPTRIVLPY